MPQRAQITAGATELGRERKPPSKKACAIRDVPRAGGAPEEGRRGHSVLSVCPPFPVHPLPILLLFTLHVLHAAPPPGGGNRRCLAATVRATPGLDDNSRGAAPR